MKHARKRWLAMIAVCLGVASPGWANPIVNSESLGSGSEGRLKISEGSGSVSMGGSPSGSVTQTQYSTSQYGVQPYSPDQALGPSAPQGIKFDDGVGYANSRVGNEILWRIGRVNLDQYGYDGGYTNFNAFVPLFGSPNNTLFFVNPRVSVTDYGFGAANLGAGIRKYDPFIDRVWGASAWWDYDDGHARSYQQIGGSLEFLNEYFSLRGNVNIPVGEKETVYNIRNVEGGTRFTGSNISIQQMFSRENALRQYDIEFSAPLPGLGQYGFDYGLGFYYLDSSEVDGAAGGSARIQSQVNENFWINGKYTYDEIFKGLFSLNFEATLPNGRSAKWFRRAPVQSYMTQSVQRNGRVAAARSTGTRDVLATKDGVVINVAFVDPNANIDPSSFDSIFDFNTAVDKANYQLIYVLSRTDDTDINLNTGVTLLDNQLLVGQGLNRFVTTDQGAVGLPSSDGPAPLLSNSGAANPFDPVITLANNNEVVGFRIDAGNTADAIFGNNITAFNIHDNSIENVINGINITTNIPTGRAYGVIANNSIDGNTNTDNQYGSLAGISVIHTGAGTLDLLVQGNVVRGIDEDANGNGVLNTETTTGVDEDFDGVIDRDEDLNGNGLRDGIGIRVIAQGGRINASQNSPTGQPTGVINNTVLASAQGFEIVSAPTVASGATIDLTFNQNTASNLTAPVADGGFAFKLGTDGTVGASTLNLYSVQGNTTSNNAGDGMIIDIVSNGQINFLGSPTFLNNDLSGNAGTGLTFNVVDSQVVIDSLSGLNVTGNEGDGLALRASGLGATIRVLEPMTGSTFTGNQGNGFVVVADNDAIIDIYFGYQNAGVTIGNNFSGNGTTVGAPSGSGLVLQAHNNGRINTALVGNLFNNNSENGATLDAQTGGVIDMSGPATPYLLPDGTVAVTAGIVGTASGATRSQSFTGNRQHGLAMLASNGGTINVPFMNGNSFNNNSLAGLYIGSLGPFPVPVANSYVTIDSAQDNLFNRTTSGTSGILFNTDEVFITLTNLLRNSFVGNPGADNNPSTAFGIGGTVTGGGLELDLVTPNNANRNVFSNNVGAHVGITFKGDAVGQVNVNNALLTNALNDSNPMDDFNGDGIALIAQDTAVLSGSIVGSRFTGNQGDGIKLMLGGSNADPALTNFSQLNNFRISNNVIGTTTAGEGNGLNGINVVRNMRGHINNLEINNNSVMGNARSGLRVSSGNSDSSDLGGVFDTFHAWGNVFSNNQNGIELRVVADADMVANIGFAPGTLPGNATTQQRNFIENNSMNGILAWEIVNSPLDTRSISGQWTNNVIRYNELDGIDFRTNAGDPMRNLNGGLIIGSGAADPALFGTNATNTNVISYNGRHGIDISGGGLYTVINNYIQYNGQNAQTATPDTPDYYLAVAGVNINGSHWETGGSPSTVGAPSLVTNTYQNVRLINNAITNNNGDGVQWVGRPSWDASPFQNEAGLTMQNNAVNLNAGRGIDLLLKNGVLGTAADSVLGDPTTAMIADELGTGGTILQSSYLRAFVDIDHNQVAGNLQEGIYLVTSASQNQSSAVASSAALQMTGSVGNSHFLDFRVANNQINGNGNAVTNFPATGLVMRIGTIAGANTLASGDLPFASGGVYGVLANVVGNTFSGNLGDDFLVHSFTSTVDPSATTGTWSTTEFTITGQQADPLARLDLVFSGNVMDSISVNNINTSLTPNGQAGAYYNNSDPFKSRLGAPTDPAGPFSSNTRRRNATRLASDWRTDPSDPSTGNLPPGAGPGATYEYAGMGNSTMRVNWLGTNTIGGIVFDNTNYGTIFLLDDPGIITNMGMVNGVGFTGANIAGELPFGWGEF